MPLTGSDRNGFKAPPSPYNDYEEGRRFGFGAGLLVGGVGGFVSALCLMLIPVVGDSMALQVCRAAVLLAP